MKPKFGTKAEDQPVHENWSLKCTVTVHISLLLFAFSLADLIFLVSVYKWWGSYCYYCSNVAGGGHSWWCSPVQIFGDMCHVFHGGRCLWHCCKVYITPRARKYDTGLLCIIIFVKYWPILTFLHWHTLWIIYCKKIPPRALKNFESW